MRTAGCVERMLSDGRVNSKLYAWPGGTFAMVGSGHSLRMFRPVWYSADAGIRPSTPPSAKQPAVLVDEHAAVEAGFLMKGYKFPVLSVVCEKSPWRSSAVGTRNR